MLPNLLSDITLEYDNKVLIIDAKYYSHIMQNRYEKETIRSANMFQIFTYVKNKEAELRINHMRSQVCCCMHRLIMERSLIVVTK